MSNYSNMKGKSKMEERKRSTLYYVETFLLLGFFIVVTFMLSQTFITSATLSQNARDLNRAVLLAENTAEIIKASSSKEEALALLNEKENATLSENRMRVFYSKEREASADGYFIVEIEYQEESEGFTDAEITVLREGREIYILHMGYDPKEAGNGK